MILAKNYILRFSRSMQNWVIAVFIFLVLLQPIASNGSAAQRDLSIFTAEEITYIKNSGVLKAVTVDGAAPLSYKDKKGNIQGVFYEVIKRVSELTGLEFEYRIYNSVEEALNSDFDLLYGIPPQYTPENLVLTNPFLSTDTILYINASVDSEQLENKIYAAVKGSDLPEGIRKENSKYYATRAESIKAVDKGDADYGYGNSFSVAYYTKQYGLKNIVTVPIAKESREYSFAVPKEDEILLSILNKAIGSIDQNQMHALILNVATQIEREITLTMILDEYGIEIVFTILLIIILLIYGVLSFRKIGNELKNQNRKYVVLSQISNEYIYEYCFKEKCLKLYDKFNEVFYTEESLDYVRETLVDLILKGEECQDTISLPLPYGQKGTFKIVKSNVYNDYGKIEYIIGKLIDVSKEMAEKEELLVRSQTDGLTGVLNATTTKEKIRKRLAVKEQNITDVFILLDCDNFKQVNDTYGHLKGDQILVDIATCLKQSFSKCDIVGRHGGDEFCIYIKNISSNDIVMQKCADLRTLINEKGEDVSVTVSMGVVLITERETFESMFEKADEALYEAKNKGKDCYVMYGE